MVWAGADEKSLGVRVGLPAPVDPVRVLAYTHLSVSLRPDRRLAAVARVGVDGDTPAHPPTTQALSRPARCT